jgi:uncharacterized protein YoxC
MFSIQDLPTLIPAFILIALSIFLISNKNKVYTAIKAVKSFLF